MRYLLRPKLLSFLALALLIAVLPACCPIMTPFAARLNLRSTTGRVAFVSTRDDAEGEIYVMNADGSGLTRLTNHPGHHDESPVWSPALPGGGTQIAFSSDRDGNYDIYVMQADGSGLINLTNHPADDRQPAWSPDGTQIAFSSDRDGNDEIYVVRADGSGLTNLTNHPADDEFPAWSPAPPGGGTGGMWLAFMSDRDGNMDIYVLNVQDTLRSESPDGAEPVNLTNRPAYDWGPIWSPDGTRIAFESDSDIYVMNVEDALRSGGTDGSGLTNLTNSPGHDDMSPAWSPAPPGGGTGDTRIAFRSVRDDRSEIWVMNADGSGQTRLTNSRQDVRARNPAWSPDGTRIAFESNSWIFGTGIFVMNADGSGQTDLTTHPLSRNEEPVWQP